MTENPPIEELLKQYPCQSSEFENIKSAQKILKDHYSDASKTDGIELINYQLKDHFGFKGKEVKMLGDFWTEFKKNHKKQVNVKVSQEDAAYSAHQQELIAQQEVEKRNAKAERIGRIHRLWKTLKNEDGTASVDDILDARKQLKNEMFSDFWTIEGRNPKTGAKGHLSMKKREIAEYIYRAYNIVRYGGRNWWYDWDSAFYRYDNDDAFLHKDVSDIMKKVGGEYQGENYQYNGNADGDTRNILKLARDTDVYIDNPFNREHGCINAKNGVLRLDYANRKVEVIGKQPSYKFTYCINTTYNQHPTTDRIHYELEKMVGVYQRELIYQMAALAIRDADPTLDPSKIAYIFLGKRDAGKGVVQKLIEEFLGKNVVSHARLIDIVENKFIKASLEGKLINFDPELPEQLPLKESSEIKALTGGKLHRIEEKGVKGYDGIITALLVFEGNQFPKCEVSKEDSAFWDRWEIIDFPHRFPRTANFTKELFTEENLSSFFNHVIEKLFDLHETNGVLKRNIQSYDVYTRWMASSSTVFRFMDVMTDMCDSEQEYTKEEFFGWYQKWCQHMKIPQSDRARNISEFSHELKDTCDVKIGRSGSYIKGSTDDREYVYRMYRTYEEVNIMEPEEPVYVSEEYTNENGDTVEVISVIDEDGNQRVVNEHIKN